MNQVANESNERRDTKVECFDCGWNRGREKKKENDAMRAEGYSLVTGASHSLAV